MTRTVTNLRFIGDWGVWLAVVIALALAGAAWWFYWCEYRRFEQHNGRAKQ